VAALLERGPELEVVVDLAVDDRRDLPVLGGERLVASPDVDDREPGMGERERADPPQGITVGPAMPQRLDHPLGRIGPRRAGRIEDCTDPAHARGSWQEARRSLVTQPHRSCHPQVWSRAPFLRSI
jgi:hypothetical protein